MPPTTEELVANLQNIGIAWGVETAGLAQTWPCIDEVEKGEGEQLRPLGLPGYHPIH
jgi:hypothetical protein